MDYIHSDNQIKFMLNLAVKGHGENMSMSDRSSKIHGLLARGQNP